MSSWPRGADLLPPTPAVAAILELLLGAWLLAAPWLLVFRSTRATACEIATGAVVVAAGALTLVRPALTRRAQSVCGLAGAVLVVAGAAFAEDGLVRLDELLIGTLVAALAVLALVTVGRDEPLRPR